MAPAKKMEITITGRDMENSSSLYVASGDVKLCSHLGNSVAAPEPGERLPRDPATMLKAFKALRVNGHSSKYVQQLRGGNNPKHPPPGDWVLKKQSVQTEIFSAIKMQH